MDQEKRDFLISLCKQLHLIEKISNEDLKHDCYPASFSPEEIRAAEQLTQAIMQLDRLRPVLRHKFPQLKHPALL